MDSVTQVSALPADGRRRFSAAKLSAVGRIAIVTKMKIRGITGPLASASMKPMLK